MFTVCVFCGSREGNRDPFAVNARGLGKCMATRGWRLVYGGAKVGLMGCVASAALDHGGGVRGIIPDVLDWPDARWKRVKDMEVVPDLAVRKFRMMEESDAFVALPGGVGTVDEIFEIAAAKQLKIGGVERKPLYVLNVLGYFDPLQEMLRNAVRHGFLSEEDSRSVTFVQTLEYLVELLEADASGDQAS